MSANRHLGRIVALQTLYELDFRRECGDKNLDVDEVLQRNISRYRKTIDDPEFIVKLVKGVDRRIAELDAILGPVAPEWPIDQIARMDRVVLHIDCMNCCMKKPYRLKWLLTKQLNLQSHLVVIIAPNSSMACSERFYGRKMLRPRPSLKPLRK